MSDISKKSYEVLKKMNAWGLPYDYRKAKKICGIDTRVVLKHLAKQGYINNEDTRFPDKITENSSFQITGLGSDEVARHKGYRTDETRKWFTLLISIAAFVISIIALLK